MSTAQALDAETTPSRTSTSRTTKGTHRTLLAGCHPPPPHLRGSSASDLLAGEQDKSAPASFAAALSKADHGALEGHPPSDGSISCAAVASTAAGQGLEGTGGGSSAANRKGAAAKPVGGAREEEAVVVGGGAVSAGAAMDGRIGSRWVVRGGEKREEDEVENIKKRDKGRCG